MNISQSLEESSSHIERITQTTIPEPTSEILAEYDEVVGERDHFLWQWLYYLFPEIQLSCVSPESGTRVRDAKLLASLYVVLLDDLAEIEQDERTFQEAAKVPFRHKTPDITRSGVDGSFVELSARVWAHVEEIVDSSPRNEEFRDLLEFDLKQNLNAIEYSYLISENPSLANVEETTTYDGHNMMLFTYVDLDLMHSPTFDREELATLRNVVRRIQQMARIGNWVTTWERELEEGDFSSGVVVAALEDDVVSPGQLRQLRTGHSPTDRNEIATSIRDAAIEERFLQQWIDLYSDVETYQSELETVDVESVLDGMNTVLECHLASRGLK